MVGSVPHSPESTTASTTWSSSSLISQPWVIGSSWSGSSSVDGQQRLAQLGQQRLRDDVVAGCARPTVRFFGCSSRRGTSLVAGRMNV